MELGVNAGPGTVFTVVGVPVTTGVAVGVSVIVGEGLCPIKVGVGV